MISSRFRNGHLLFLFTKYDRYRIITFLQCNRLIGDRSFYDLPGMINFRFPAVTFVVIVIFILVLILNR